MAANPDETTTDPRITRREPMHPQVRQLFEASYAQKTGAEPNIAATRALNEATATFFSMGAPVLAVDREIAIPGPAGDMRAVLNSPREGGAPMPLVLYLHGGGYCIMSPEALGRVAKTIARDAEAVVVNLDYRMAPEDPYPAPVDDAVAAYRWLRAHAGEIGGDGTRVAIAGDSAGGGLAAATTLRLIDEGDEPPAGVAMFCAWLDLHLDTWSFLEYGPDDALIDTPTMTLWRDSYAPDVATRDLPYASPLLGDVSSYPPSFVAVAELDPLRDEGRAFAENLRGTGRDVTFVEHAQMPHDFILFPTLETATPAVGQMVAWLRGRLRA